MPAAVSNVINHAHHINYLRFTSLWQPHFWTVCTQKNDGNGMGHVFCTTAVQKLNKASRLRLILACGVTMPSIWGQFFHLSWILLTLPYTVWLPSTCTCFSYGSHIVRLLKQICRRWVPKLEHKCHRILQECLSPSHSGAADVSKCTHTSILQSQNVIGFYVE